MNEPRLVSIRDAARFVDCSESDINRAISRKVLAVKRVGTRVFILEDSLSAFAQLRAEYRQWKQGYQALERNVGLMAG
jgi:hypothetical protein